MKKTALITGATAGIGAKFAHLLAKEDFNLVLVARDNTRLHETAQSLTEEYGIGCEVIRADLTTDEGCSLIEERLSRAEEPIEVLINNAGFAIRDSFLKSSREDEIRLFDILCRTPMRLMHAVLPGMKVRSSGTIINVSSVAGWMASGTYSASKSYLTVLSESLHSNLQGTNIHVIALCPGFTHTEFHERGNIDMRFLPKFLWLNADQVVAQAWSDAKAGKALSIPGRQYQIISTIVRFGPRPWVRKFGRTIRRRQRRD
jgi:short-subunit dehydrogenase